MLLSEIESVSNTISQGWDQELLLFQSKVGNSCRYKQILYLSNLCCATSSIDCPPDAFLETKCPDLLLEISFVQIVFRISLTDR